ncbi:hypothetical protein B0T26DRAFT_755552 [Lasiosphaeria miniovina]|uniref:Uncharacterized protein n=1 Tax=Lasiosphaeria miniovina TaxID=1954250 RepID=A0AA40DJL3_9PEZI|nr:uncharacterized protein B0T26DRAFT_755552 [Lasiosphaeria miniovina]KAK0706009.1 hypothetical protein B0T26DRAFT_755552 [Lasiosphaeria miniovina]
MAMLEPYRHLSRRQQAPSYATAAILTPRAAEPVTGLWRAVRQRDILGSAIASATILSKAAPIFLSNIPFRSTLTWDAHLVCAWTCKIATRKSSDNGR